MKHFTTLDVDFIYNYLIDKEYFTEEELCLVVKAFGDNIDTYNTIIYTRYGYDFEQLYDLEENL